MEFENPSLADGAVHPQSSLLIGPHLGAHCYSSPLYTAFLFCLVRLVYVYSSYRPSISMEDVFMLDFPASELGETFNYLPLFTPVFS